MFGKGIPTFFGHFDVTLTINHRVYYKRKGGGAFSSLSYNASYEFGLFMGCLCTI
jgi:hypothetical protein